MRNTRNGQETCYLSATDIAAFHRLFVTINTLVAEMGMHRNTLRRFLTSAKVLVFSPAGEDFGLLYLRDKAENALRQRS